MVLWVIRSRPAGVGKASVSKEIESLPGLDLGPAFLSAPFWLLSWHRAVGLNATFYHMVPYLIFTPVMLLGTQLFSGRP